MASQGSLGGCVEADVSLLKGIVDDVCAPLHKVLASDCRLDYPCCSWASSSMAARYLREVGFHAEVIPLIHLGGILEGEPGKLKRLLELSVSEREPSNLCALFGKGFSEGLGANAHQAVGVRIHDGMRIRLYLVDFLLPQLFGSVGTSQDYVFSEIDPEGLHERYGLVMVSPKFIRFPRMECRFLSVVGSLAVDLSDDYKTFKAMVDRSRCR